MEIFLTESSSDVESRISCNADMNANADPGSASASLRIWIQME